jgi:hypothetical protein
MSQPTFPDRFTDEMRAELLGITRLDDDELLETESRAARTFTGYTLHTKLPFDRQGDTGPRAWALRRQRAEAAEMLWLAIQAEYIRRRHHNHTEESDQ